MSVTHTWLGPVGGDIRARRLGAGACLCRLSVVWGFPSRGIVGEHVDQDIGVQ